MKKQFSGQSVPSIFFWKMHWVGKIVGKNNPTIPLKKSLSLILTHLTYFAITIIFWMYVYVQDLLDFNYEEGKEEEIIYSHREMCPTENWARELLAKEFLQFL